MRISGGTVRGLTLRSLRGTFLRPTATKVKEALFDVLGPRVIGATLVDFFAGTGNIGIEALSRGAAHVVFIEKHRPSIKLLKTNLARCGLSDKATLCNMDATVFLRRFKRRPVTEGRASGFAGAGLPHPFDILFVDPPYHGPLAQSFLRHLGQSDIINKNSIVVFEHFHKQVLPERTGCLGLVKRYRYGDTLLSLYQYQSTSAEASGGAEPK